MRCSDEGEALSLAAEFERRPQSQAACSRSTQALELIILLTMAELPTGTVTFLFTDIEGSTRLLHELGDALRGRARRSIDACCARRSLAHGGVEVDTQGDAFFVAFATASDALAAADDGAGGARRRARSACAWASTPASRSSTDEGYVGIDVHRAARIAAAGHGGQMLVSQSTRDLVGRDGLRDLGEHRLKDLTAPERIYQLGER